VFVAQASEPAVSPVSNRQSVISSNAFESGNALQIENLRYSRFGGPRYVPLAVRVEDLFCARSLALLEFVNGLDYFREVHLVHFYAFADALEQGDR
jgi:hypothetical protein